MSLIHGNIANEVCILGIVKTRVSQREVTPTHPPREVAGYVVAKEDEKKK